MRYIEPHAHMVSRTTDDYQALDGGLQAVCEPAFWAGFDPAQSQASMTTTANSLSMSPSAPPLPPATLPRSASTLRKLKTLCSRMK